jgi:hypothetical protein
MALAKVTLRRIRRALCIWMITTLDTCTAAKLETLHILLSRKFGFCKSKKWEKFLKWKFIDEKRVNFKKKRAFFDFEGKFKEKSECEYKNLSGTTHEKNSSA